MYTILQIIETSGPGGAETVVLNIAKNLNPEKFKSLVVLHRPGWFFQHLQEQGVDARIIHSKQSWDISFITRLVKYCKQQKVDLIHSHLSGANLYSCLAGFILRIPVIATYHNELYMPTSTEKYVPIKNLIIRNLASRTVLVANYMRDKYIKLGKFPDNRLVTIYNGISLGLVNKDYNLAQLRQELGIALNDPIIGNVANLRPPKGHEYLIEAAAILCKQFPNTRFLLIGEGERKKRLKEKIIRQIAELKLQENVKLLGYRSDVRELLQLMDVFVLASTSEGLPLSVVEAHAASKPIVATNIGGLSEIVEDDKSGFLVEPKNPHILAEKLLTLIRNRTLREEMGNYGEMVVRSKFSIDTMINKYQELYGELLN